MHTQLSNEYREKKKQVDKLKEDLQVKINEYTKFVEQGESPVCYIRVLPTHNKFPAVPKDTITCFWMQKHRK